MRAGNAVRGDAGKVSDIDAGGNRQVPDSNKWARSRTPDAWRMIVGDGVIGGTVSDRTVCDVRIQDGSHWHSYQY
ncbi:hypothetical protein Acsp01_24190 [Actinoplanes sp. NBRC 101535]|nr:hypothetical protein Acsp01_24190 [Actinoplanes sp. NBRC 101535]